MHNVSADWSNRRNNISRYRCAVSTIRRLKRAVEDGHSEIQLDLEDVEWISCVYSAPLATAVQSLRNEGADIKIKFPSKIPTSNYLRTLGFPEGMKKPQWSERTYLPLIQLNTPGEQSAVDAAGDTLRNLIIKLLGDNGDVSIDGIYLPIGELLDNVDQHSQCDHGVATVQYYPKKGRLDLCIVDDGVSIPGNFEDHGIAFDSDTDAVRRALTEGLSTKKERDAKGRKRGTGFRTTANIIEALDGEILVSSRDGTIYRRRKPRPIDNCYWDGTVIFGSLNVPKIGFNTLDYVAT